MCHHWFAYGTSNVLQCGHLIDIHHMTMMTEPNGNAAKNLRVFILRNSFLCNVNPTCVCALCTLVRVRVCVLKPYARTHKEPLYSGPLHGGTWCGGSCGIPAHRDSAWDTSFTCVINYRQISNIRRTKYQTLHVSCLVLHLPLPNPLKSDIKSRMKM